LLFYGDEIRVGLRTNHKRRWTPLNLRPSWKTKISYQFRYFLVFINPLKGALHIYEMDSMKSELLKKVVKNFINVVCDKSKIIWDNAGSHVKVAKELLEEGIDMIKFLPPYSPELNPVERFFLEIRKATANKIFEDIEEVKEFIKKEMDKWKRFPQKLTQLTAFPYIKGHY